MNSWNSQKRVEAVLNHEKPDRVPIDFMGNASMMIDERYHELREYLNLPTIKPIRRGHPANYYDERILEFLNIDFRRIFLPKKNSISWKNEREQIFTDEWGIKYQKKDNFVNILDNPLQDINSVSEVECYDWPDPQEIFTTEGLREKVKIRSQEDYALVARNPLSKGFLDQGSALMGTVNFFKSLIKKPKVAHRVIDKLLNIYIDVYTMFLSAVGDYVQIVETADDLGTQEDLLISPKLYREFIKPADSELYNVIHEMAPDAKLFKHCDGAIFEIISDFIEIGVDILNPIQTSCKGMDTDKLKREYGDSIVFHGGIENLGGETEAVLNEVEEKIDILGLGGGYILAPCNHILEASPDQVIKMFQKAKEYGVYKT